MQPITIGIPFFNNERTLPDAIRSVFAQTCGDWELLLVDDGSRDASLEIARAVRDPRVRVISDGANRGLPARLNQIVLEAKFDLIGRMDADDMMSPHRFSRQLELMKEQTVQIVTSGMAMLSAENRFVGYRRGARAISMLNLLRGHGISHAPLLGRAAWFTKNPYDMNCPRSQDAELWCRTYHQGQLRAEDVRMIDEPLYFCREEDGLSLKKVLASHQVLRDLIMKYGVAELGTVGTLRELLRSHLRSAVLRGASMIGLLSYAAARGRNDAIRDGQLLSRLQAELTRVLDTKVPGLD